MKRVQWEQDSVDELIAQDALHLSRMALHTLLRRPFIALVVYRIARTGAAKAKNGITRSQCRCQLSVTVGKSRPHAPFSNALSVAWAALESSA